MEVDSTRSTHSAVWAGAAASAIVIVVAVIAGMSDELIVSLGELPRQHGLLGAMLEPTCRSARRTAARTRASGAGGRRRTRR